jgi:hypothetical protein
MVAGPPEQCVHNTRGKAQGTRRLSITRGVARVLAYLAAHTWDLVSDANSGPINGPEFVPIQAAPSPRAVHRECCR